MALKIIDLKATEIDVFDMRNDEFIKSINRIP